MEKEELRVNEEASERRKKRKPSSKAAKILVKGSNCKGCGLCVDICPAGVLGLVEDPENKWGISVKVEGVDFCIGCKMCEMQCPDFAIFVNILNDEENSL